MYQLRQDQVHFLLVHPGGPFFRNKELGSWSIPKGLVEPHEDPLTTARREFEEETSITAEPPFLELGMVKQKGGKVVHAWAFICPEKYQKWQPDKDLVSNEFTMEWPPRSGKIQSFPEIDKAAWFNYNEAVVKINQAQVPLLERAILRIDGPEMD